MYSVHGYYLGRGWELYTVVEKSFSKRGREGDYPQGLGWGGLSTGGRVGGIIQYPQGVNCS